MDTELSSITARARVHAALGDVARLAIVDALVLGDASPGELGGALGLPTNLVAHHLRVLVEAGLVVRTPSEGDRRRSYLRLVPDVLTSLLPVQVRAVARVVFVCTHNSARSQLARALWAQRSSVPVASAGTAPATQVHRRAVEVASRHGLTIAVNATAHVVDVVRPADFVIAVCDNAYEGMAGGARPALHWSVPDPARLDTDAAFEAAFEEIANRIDRFVPIVVQGETP